MEVTACGLLMIDVKCRRASSALYRVLDPDLISRTGTFGVSE